MEWLSYLQVALDNIVSSKMRSLLTILGVLVGTASVVALVSGGELATEQALAQFTSMGTNLMSVSIESGGKENAPKLGLADIPKIVAANVDITAVAPYANSYLAIRVNGLPLENGSIVGATEELAKVVAAKVQSGRFVSVLDKRQRFAVIGDSVMTELRKQGVFDPLNATVQAGTTFYRVIGVLEKVPENMFLYMDLNKALIVPLENALTTNQYAEVNNIIFQLRDKANLTAIENHVTTVLNRLLPNTRLFFRSASEIINSMQKQSRTFTILLGFIGSISLLVGGIGVMNIMLVSVVERRREIGIRMAVGARRQDIQFMFLAESIVLCLLGGLMGILIGVLASFITAYVSNWPFHLLLFPPLVGFLVSVLVGVFFGFYPARRASMMDPIVCLTAE